MEEDDNVERDDLVEEDVLKYLCDLYGGSTDDQNEERRTDDGGYDGDGSDGGEQDYDVANLTVEKEVAEVVVEKDDTTIDNVEACDTRQFQVNSVSPNFVN